MPAVTYAACIDSSKMQREIEVRKLGRIPTVVYVYGQNEKSRIEGCAIWRSAEPKSDIMTFASDADKEYIQLMSQIHIESD